MTTTGWTGEDTEGPGMPTASLLLSMRAERGPVDPLERARAAADRPDADPLDADEHAANLLARGYAPGHVSQLAQRYAETMAELETERGKIAATARRQERIAREHAAGRISAFDIANMGDADEGDAHRAEQLERRADNLQRQLAGAQETMIAPPQERQLEPVAEAGRHAHAIFAEVTRAKMAAAEAGRPAPRPFASVSRAGVAVRTEVLCADCTTYGATPEQSYLIHADPDAPAGVRLPVAELTDADLAEFGREAGLPYRPAGSW